MSSQPYYPPYDPSASPQSSQSSRSNYPQPVYNQYNQQAYGHMGYTDMPQSGRYSQMPLQYPPESAEGAQYMNQDGYAPPSFSPTAATFAQSHSYGPANADAMTYRRRYQSTSAVMPAGSRHPTPRHPSGEVPMAPMPEGREFVPVPSQPFHESNAPVVRPAASRSSNVGQSPTTSALALEKPYVCDICQTRFARHHDCRRHRETHVVNASGEKPHHCVVCGKSFTRKDALKRQADPRVRHLLD